MATTTQPDLIAELVDGDRLTAAEFERRYRASARIKKAELVAGVVYVASPVSDIHGPAHSDLNGWVQFYRLGTPFLICSIEGTIRHDDQNQTQPDVHLRIDQDHGGRSSRSLDHFVEGSPELVAEIAVSSRSIDLNQKLEAYRKLGIPEYIVWRVLDRAIDWFLLRGDRYDRLAADAAGIFRSEIFPGLWLDSAALIRGDLPSVYQAVQRGLATAEHATFVEKLRDAGPV